MYGTISRVRVKPGMGDQFEQLRREEVTFAIPGLAFEYIYRLDARRDEYILVVGFESEDAYVANARSPEQHARYLQFRELLTADPEWHDGEIVFSHLA